MSSSQISKRILIIASGNAGKIREFSNLLAHIPLEIRPQPTGLHVEETGSSFSANARIKATAVAAATGQWALADDSGLSVAALNGAPGVHSARYAENDEARIARLLNELEAAKSSDRSAHFTAALAVADPSGKIRLEVEGECPGMILKTPRGEGGFGYDPVFYVPEVGQTFAEMEKVAKARLGHRGRAFNALEPELSQLLTDPSESPAVLT
ncbi:MAG TPA: RdgB/HAM1 family non-canonical purine NTP pyrophosphatase [Prochlorococcus sp.]|tara:strand:- start:742 stop:1374 length:633 start_codon:yes stop_codon:yes gene_type:complete